MRYTPGGFQWYPQFCLSMIVDCCGTGKQKQYRVATIKKARPASGKNKALVSIKLI